MERGITRETAAFIITASAVYMAFKGSECGGRMSEIASVLMLIFILFIFAVSLVFFDSESIIITPPEKNGIPKGAAMTFGSLCACEYVFILSAKTNNTKKSASAVLTGFLITTFVLSLGTALSISAFGVNEAKRKVWPLIQMMNYSQFPGSLVERQEVLMSGFYIISSYILTGVSIYIASSLLKKIFKSEKITFICFDISIPKCNKF